MAGSNVGIESVQAGLLILLVVVYTCSDWLMDLRSRRKAFAREMAARQAHERISKYERLKQVTDTAKRQASKFTRKLTRTKSRKQPEFPTEEELQESKQAAFIVLIYGRFIAECLRPENIS